MLVYECVCVCVRLIKVLSFLDSKKSGINYQQAVQLGKEPCGETQFLQYSFTCTAERAKWTSLEKAAARAGLTKRYKAVGWNSAPSWTGN